LIQGHVTSSASISPTGRSIGCISTSFRLYTFRAFGFVLTVPVLFTLSNSTSDAEDDTPYDDSVFRTTPERNRKASEMHEQAPEYFSQLIEDPTNVQQYDGTLKVKTRQETGFGRIRWAELNPAVRRIGLTRLVIVDILGWLA
jgi:hypothetical protein